MQQFLKWTLPHFPHKLWHAKKKESITFFLNKLKANQGTLINNCFPFQIESVHKRVWRKRVAYMIWYSCPKEWLSHQLPGPGFSKMSNSWMNSFTFNQFVCLIQMDSAIISSPLFHPANIFTTFSSLPQRTFRQLSCTSTSHLVCSVCSLPFVCSASGNHSGR